jgi:threonine dehydrogenase-like Zn-dependent dehydrogenase
LIGAGSQSTYALQCALAMGAQKVILANRGIERMQRVLRDFGNEKVVGVEWNEDVVKNVLAQCKPFNEPHFVMMNAPAEAGYRLSTELLGYGTVLDAHAGVKGAKGKPNIAHEVDLNNDIHYKLQCYQATHGSNWHGIGLAREMINGKKLPLLDKMTHSSERFHHSQIREAIARAADKDSLKVIINFEDA